MSRNIVFALVVAVILLIIYREYNIKERFDDLSMSRSDWRRLPILRWISIGALIILFIIVIIEVIRVTIEYNRTGNGTSSLLNVVIK
uniref:Uncharacterized protein n=1 Tax=viral metagenome TaxID=1070528 RepID=A0A6C0DDQ0_9ZZZZ